MRLRICREKVVPMRPKLLEIEGLQSFRNFQRIDFDVLGQTGLFGIFGPTGSGKSTVLDAITFALYGKVKRAERGTQGIINTNLNNVRVSFTFEILRDGKRRTYRVDRVYRRKKGSLNSCEPKVARLIEITEAGEIPICDKASEVTSSIEDLLGLKHDDFTRAVVLPQNSFQEFLLLDNAQKRKMLERIFYLEEYGTRLWEKLARKMVHLKSRIDRLSGELAAYADATGESLEKARQEMEAAATEKARLEKELKELEARYNEARDIWQLVQELSALEEKEKEHMAAKEDIERKRLQLDKAQKAGELREIVFKKNELSDKLEGTERDLQEIEVKIPAAVSCLEENKKQYEGLKREIAEQQPRLVEKKTRLAEALKIKEETGVLRRKAETLISETDALEKEIDVKKSDMEVVTGDIASMKAALEELAKKMESLKTDPEYRNAIQEGDRLEREIAALVSSVDSGREKLRGLEDTITGLEGELHRSSTRTEELQKALEELEGKKQQNSLSRPGDRDTLTRERELILSLRGTFEALKLRQGEIRAVEKKLGNHQAEIERYLKSEQVLKEEQVAAEAARQEARLKLEQAVKLRDRNTAYLLSKTLKEGEPCPVCGSEHHPHPAAAATTGETAAAEKQVETAKVELAEAEKALKEAEKKCLAAGEHISALEEQIEETKKELEAKRQDYEETRAALPMEFGSLDLEQLQQELEARDRLTSQKLFDFSAWEKQQEQFQAELQAINEQLSLQRLNENRINTELKVKGESRERDQEVLEDACRELTKKESRHRDFLQRFNIESAAVELDRLADNDRELVRLQKETEKTRKRQNESQSVFEKLQEELQVLNSQIIKLEADKTNTAGQISEKEKQLFQLAGDLDIEEEIHRINARLDRYTENEQDLSESLEVLKKECQNLISQRATLENQRKIYAGDLEQVEASLNKVLREKGFTDTSEVEGYLLPEEEQTQLQDEINAFDEAGRELLAQKGAVKVKLKGRTITREEWDRLSNAYRDTSALKEEWVSASEVARNEFHKLKARHDKLLELTKAFTELENKYGLMEHIQRLLRADKGKDNSFIDFIAEERLRYVAAKASETLGVMTKHKYALELDADAGFIIRDFANGGVCRMVNSLSGGETFLTSLSLALALSEQIQLKGQSPLELFFLDEGFGTLDDNLLDTVIDSLERLSSSDRVIGLISHVPELRQRIPRRLIVDPPSANGEGSRVRTEMA